MASPAPYAVPRIIPAPAKAAQGTPAPEELDALRETIKGLDKERKAAEKKEASLEKNKRLRRMRLSR